MVHDEPFAVRRPREAGLEEHIEWRDCVCAAAIGRDHPDAAVVDERDPVTARRPLRVGADDVERRRLPRRDVDDLELGRRVWCRVVVDHGLQSVGRQRHVRLDHVEAFVAHGRTHSLRTTSGERDTVDDLVIIAIPGAEVDPLAVRTDIDRTDLADAGAARHDEGTHAGGGHAIKGARVAIETAHEVAAVGRPR